MRFFKVYSVLRPLLISKFAGSDDKCLKSDNIVLFEAININVTIAYFRTFCENI